MLLPLKVGQPGTAPRKGGTSVARFWPPSFSSHGVPTFPFLSRDTLHSSGASGIHVPQQPFVGAAGEGGALGLTQGDP